MPAMGLCICSPPQASRVLGRVRDWQYKFRCGLFLEDESHGWARVGSFWALGSWLFAPDYLDSGTQGSPEKNLARALVT